MPRGIPNVDTNKGVAAPAIDEKKDIANSTQSQVPPSQDVPPNADANKGVDGDFVKITSAERKNKSIIAVTGKVIFFDAEGAAKVSRADALYLESCPGFVVG